MVLFYIFQKISMAKQKLASVDDHLFIWLFFLGKKSFNNSLLICDAYLGIIIRFDVIISDFGG